MGPLIVKTDLVSIKADQNLNENVSSKTVKLMKVLSFLMLRSTYKHQEAVPFTTDFASDLSSIFEFFPVWYNFQCKIFRNFLEPDILEKKLECNV